MNINLKEHFFINEDGVSYTVPSYEVVDGQGIKELGSHGVNIDFVRGNKLGTEDVAKRKGTLHEHLLAVQIHDLEFKNNIVPSIETLYAIKNLKQALHWLRARSIDRVKRDVQGTYQK